MQLSPGIRLTSGPPISALALLHRLLYSFLMSLAEAEPLPITEASRRGVSKLVTDAENGHPTILRRHSEPVAAVIGIQELQRLQGLERDLIDVALVLTRSASDNGKRTSLDSAIESLGYTRDRLAEMEEPA